MAGLAVRPKTRMRWTGSAVCLASSRIRSCRTLDGVRPSPAKMASTTVRAIGGPAVSAAVWLVTSRWGLRGEGPAAVPFAEPAGHERAGELVEVDGVRSGRAADGELAAGQVEVLEQQEGCLLLAEPVDGDQGDDDLGDRGAGPVDQPAELVGGDRGGQSLHGRQGDPAGRVPEDDPLLLECPEQAAQGGQQVVRRDARVAGSSASWTSSLVISRRLVTCWLQPARTGQKQLR